MFNKNLFVFFGLLAILLIAGCAKNSTGDKTKTIKLDIPQFSQFSSCSDLSDAFKQAQKSYRNSFYEPSPLSIASSLPFAPLVSKSEAKTISPVSLDYSQTNVQVAGVDEGDIVKTDGKYIYTISKGKLHIADAYPADSARILSITTLQNISPYEIFIDKDRILVFGAYEGFSGFSKPSPQYESYTYKQFTKLQLFDISDKKNPKIIKSVDFEGKYISSRKINSTVYFVINNYPDYYILEKSPVKTPEQIIPQYREDNKDFSPIAKCGEIGYLKPINAQAFVIVGSISMQDTKAPISKEVIVASGQNVYASKDNLYLAEVKYDYVGEVAQNNLIDNLLGTQSTPKWSTKEKTVIHKFSLEAGNISYLGHMEAPGRILNQFSMDEHKSYFRIATTTGVLTQYGSKTSNNVYVFGEDLKMKGKLEDLAPGEAIYATRFMGNKLYMVTFKKVDPLFVIDLSKPENPKVLGKLKIPGYSDYLHPIDENHIIGIGKETAEAKEGDFAWFQGIKMAVFDVSNVEKPKEMHKVIIGDRGTDSYALHDHKAFLYDKEKNLLVIPILLAEIDKEKYGKNIPANTYGDYVFQGVYVYDLTLENGFNMRGRITHIDNNDSFKKSGYYFSGYGDEVKRSLYIGNYLYTVSDNKILVNTLKDLTLVKELKLQ